MIRLFEVHPDVFSLQGIEIVPWTGLLVVGSTRNEYLSKVIAVVNVDGALVQPRARYGNFANMNRSYTKSTTAANARIALQSPY